MKSRTRPTNRRVRGGRNHLLDVQIRTSTARRQRQEKVGRWIFNIVLIALIGVASVLGVRTALDKFFFRNADYVLSRITLDLDDIMSREEALETAGVREGVNIFSVDLSKVEANLKALPEVQDVQIQRELPDHLTIKLTARQPIAWLSAAADSDDPTTSERSLLVDASGFVMRPKRISPEQMHLPVITGVKSDNIRNGEMLQNDGLKAALELLAVVTQNPESPLKIRTMDVSKEYCIEVVNDQNARITFATSDYEGQLDRLHKLLTYCGENARTLDSVNLMVKRNTPVTFVMAAASTIEPPTAPATPAKSGGHGSTRSRRE